jgi:predicted transcriptional regulator
MVKTTTIQIQGLTKEKLDSLKDYARETYDEIIQDLIALREEETLELSKSSKKAIEEAYEDIKMGRVYTTKQLIKELGI